TLMSRSARWRRSGWPSRLIGTWRRGGADRRATADPTDDERADGRSADGHPTGEAPADGVQGGTADADADAADADADADDAGDRREGEG
ncbi:hypothetical protein, partial [Streptomyces spiramenti]